MERQYDGIFGNNTKADLKGRGLIKGLMVPMFLITGMKSMLVNEVKYEKRTKTAVPSCHGRRYR